jgi:CopG antitoxin of type II toxin-antitoxin system
MTPKVRRARRRSRFLLDAGQDDDSPFRHYFTMQFPPEERQALQVLASSPPAERKNRTHHQEGRTERSDDVNAPDIGDVKMGDLKKIPVFATEDEESEFWANHDSTDYIDWAQAKPTRFEALKKSNNEKGERMSFLLINASREELEAAFTSAKLKLLAEGGPYDLASYVSAHRDEVTELAFVLQTRLTKGPDGHRVEWCDASRELLNDLGVGNDAATAEWECLVGQVVLDVLRALRQRMRSEP